MSQNQDFRQSFHSNQEQVRRLARLAMLFALALVFSWFEGLLPTFMPIPVRYGLSNIPVMFCILSLGLPSAVLLALFKSAFVLFTRAAMAASLSLAGGICSVIVMYYADHLFKEKLSYILLSVLGAIAHNLAQFFLVLALFNTGAKAVVYGLLPPLIIFGIFSGVITGFALHAVLPLVNKAAEKD